METIAVFVLIGILIYMISKIYTASQSQEYKDLKEEYLKDYEKRKEAKKNGVKFDSTIIQSKTSSNRTNNRYSTSHSNPSTGLPMSNGIGGVDVSGKSYGIN